MALASLRLLFQRDIRKLYREVEAYAKDHARWQVNGEIKNTAGES
jgi:hypothetical protein